MSCSSCAIHARFSLSGAYNFGCLQCCTRLVLSTHPSKKQASVMLAAIERFENSPDREEIINGVKTVLAQRKKLEATPSTDPTISLF